MSGNIAVIYTGDLAGVANAFAEGAAQAASQVKTAQLSESGDPATGSDSQATLSHLEWADGIAFGTPAHDSGPSTALMRFLDRSESLWKSGRLYDKAVTVFTDEPECMAPDAILHPIYDALYRWGAVIVGPKAFDLGSTTAPGGPATAGSSLAATRLRAAHYRARRLARLASVLAEERMRTQRLQL